MTRRIYLKEGEGAVAREILTPQHLPAHSEVGSIVLVHFFLMIAS